MSNFLKNLFKSDRNDNDQQSGEHDHDHRQHRLGLRESMVVNPNQMNVQQLPGNFSSNPHFEQMTWMATERR